MNNIHWYEIPVADIQRASKFYGAVLNQTIQVTDLTEQMGSMLGMLPGGALVQNVQHGYEPAATGTLIYLTVDEDLNETLARVEASNGQVVLPKTPMGQDKGFCAWVMDTEGNKVGLYSTK
jgi:predicted enzyme related to lactoylglutathione lyase